MRQNRHYLLVLFLVPSLTSCFQNNNQTSGKAFPNIVLIMADDLGYGHLGCYGQEKIQTPNLDRLAAEGMRFTQAYSGSAVCAPSRSVLMTGYHAGHTPVRGNGGGASLREEDITMAQMFKKKGYVTGLFGKWGLGAEGTAGIPNKKGFDEFFGYLHQLHAQFYYPEFLWHNQEKVFFPENKNLAYQTYSHDLIMEKATRFIEENQDTTFFCYLPLAIPHHEFIAPDSALDLYKGKFPEQPIDFWRENYALPDEPKATMAAMISHLDFTIGNFLRQLDNLNLADNTLVIFTSDNGPAVGPLENPDFFDAAGGLRGYKGDLYEGGLRVPFMVRWPGKIQTNSESDQQIYFGDLFPTFADLLDLEGNHIKQLDGISVLPAILKEDGVLKRDFIYWEVGDYTREPPFDLIPSTLMQSIRKDQWKLIRNSPESPLELFNLEQDPKELNNLAEQNPGLVKELYEVMIQNHQKAPPQKDMSREEAADKYIPTHE